MARCEVESSASAGAGSAWASKAEERIFFIDPKDYIIRAGLQKKADAKNDTGSLLDVADCPCAR